MKHLLIIAACALLIGCNEEAQVLSKPIPIISAPDVVPNPVVPATPQQAEEPSKQPSVPSTTPVVEKTCISFIDANGKKVEKCKYQEIHEKRDGKPVPVK